MSVRSTVSVLGLILLCWGVLEFANALGFGVGTLGLFVKCAAITAVGGLAGAAVGRWVYPDHEFVPAAVPFALVGPLIAAVHFANYLVGGLVPLMLEVAIMTLGSFLVQAIAAAALAKKA